MQLGGNTVSLDAPNTISMFVSCVAPLKNARFISGAVPAPINDCEPLLSSCNKSMTGLPLVVIVTLKLVICAKVLDVNETAPQLELIASFGLAKVGILPPLKVCAAVPVIKLCVPEDDVSVSAVLAGVAGGSVRV